MRVIAGTAKSLPLRTVSGSATRPTTDRIKETLFNMIADRIDGCRFLDLFAGSGGIGIEALSRGAQSAAFVDSSRQALSVIRDNLNFTKLSPRGRVIAGDAVRIVRSMNGEHPYDIIFMDPPYDHGLEREVCEALSSSSICSPDTLIIIEASAETDFGWTEELGYEVLRVKPYGSNQHVFLKRKVA